jgi:hypothetical protein
MYGIISANIISISTQMWASFTYNDYTGWSLVRNSPAWGICIKKSTERRRSRSKIQTKMNHFVGKKNILYIYIYTYTIIYIHVYIFTASNPPADLPAKNNMEITMK